MSIELVSEVFNHCPAEVTPAERLILLAIAEQSQEGDRWVDGVFWASRTCRPRIGCMGEMTGLGPSGLGDALRRLSKRGLEARVAISVDKIGRPVFAASGHRTVYRLPILEGLALTTPSSAKGPALTTPSGAKGPALTTQRSCPDDSMVLPQQGPNRNKPEVTNLPTLIDVSRPTASNRKAEKEKDLKKEFDQWYSAYPRKMAPAAARKAFDKARKTVDFQTLLTAAQSFARVRRTENPNYTPYPAKWLNQGSWEDELTPQRSQSTAGVPVPGGEIDPDVILGKDYWVPGTPPAVLTIHEEMAWKDQRIKEHRAERLAEARRRVALV